MKRPHAEFSDQKADAGSKSDKSKTKHAKIGRRRTPHIISCKDANRSAKIEQNRFLKSTLRNKIIIKVHEIVPFTDDTEPRACCKIKLSFVVNSR